jgi:hypothetical protein
MPELDGAAARTALGKEEGARSSGSVAGPFIPLRSPEPGSLPHNSGPNAHGHGTSRA